MKKLLICLTTFVSFSLFGGILHVGPTDSVSLIPHGSYIKFTKDFNVKPVLVHHLLGSKETTKCFLYTKTSSKIDRVIKAGTKIEIEFLDMRYPRFNTPKNNKIESIFCDIPSTYNQTMTVQDFVDAISDVAVLIMSEPVEF
jgi:hypothetical protein